jgi:hypothetical protein
MGKTWTTRTKTILIQSHIKTIETNLPYTSGFLIINQFLLMFTYKKWKSFKFVMWNDFPSFLTCIFYIFAFFTPGKQPYFEISEMITHTPCARDYWWTLDFANAFLSPGVNSRAELVPEFDCPWANGAKRLSGRFG